MTNPDEFNNNDGKPMTPSDLIQQELDRIEAEKQAELEKDPNYVDPYKEDEERFNQTGGHLMTQEELDATPNVTRDDYDHMLESFKEGYHGLVDGKTVEEIKAEDEAKASPVAPTTPEKEQDKEVATLTPVAPQPEPETGISDANSKKEDTPSSVVSGTTPTEEKQAPKTDSKEVAPVVSGKGAEEVAPLAPVKKAQPTKQQALKAIKKAKKQAKATTTPVTAQVSTQAPVSASKDVVTPVTTETPKATEKPAVAKQGTLTTLPETGEASDVVQKTGIFAGIVSALTGFGLWARRRKQQ